MVVWDGFWQLGLPPCLCSWLCGRNSLWPPNSCLLGTLCAPFGQYWRHIHIWLPGPPMLTTRNDINISVYSIPRPPRLSKGAILRPLWMPVVFSRTLVLSWLVWGYSGVIIIIIVSPTLKLKMILIGRIWRSTCVIPSLRDPSVNVTLLLVGKPWANIPIEMHTCFQK
jgi:hypothetical protein